MKTFKFTVPFYKVEVVLIQVEGSQDIDEVRECCRKYNIDDAEQIEQYVSNGVKDGGDTFRDLGRRQMVVFFYPFSDEQERANTYSHEKRHVEDRLLEYYNVHDIESAAMLAGFIGEQFWIFENQNKLQ